jgi:hypothetical protein
MVLGKAVALHRTRGGRRRKEDMVIERAERRESEGEREVMISSAHLMRNPPVPGRRPRSFHR